MATISQLLVELRLADQMSAGLARARAGLTGFYKDAMSSSRAMQVVGLGMAGVGAGLALAVKGVVGTAENFDFVIARAGAMVHATGPQLQELGDKALQMGRDTIFGASEAAGAMQMLAQMGMSVEQIVGTPGAHNGLIDAVLNLAGATNSDLPSAARATVQTLRIFADQGVTNTQVVDDMTNSIHASGGTLAEYTDFMAGAGAAADGLHIPLAQLDAMFVELVQHGIPAATAGAGINTMITRLVNPVKAVRVALAEAGVQVYDTNGQFLGMDSLLQQLHDHLGSMTQQQQLQIEAALGGARAWKVLLQLVAGGPDVLDKTTNAIEHGNSAAAIMKETLNNLHGSLKQLRGSVDTMAVKLGQQLEPVIRFVVEAVKNAVNWFVNLPPIFDKIVAYGALATAGLMTFGGVALLAVRPVKDLIEASKVLIGVLKALTMSEEAAATAAEATGVVTQAGPLAGLVAAAPEIALVVAALAALGAAYHYNLFGFADAVNSVADSIVAAFDKVISAFDTVKGILDYFFGHAQTKRVADAPQSIPGVAGGAALPSAGTHAAAVNQSGRVQHTRPTYFPGDLSGTIVNQTSTTTRYVGETAMLRKAAEGIGHTFGMNNRQIATLRHGFEGLAKPVRQLHNTYRDLSQGAGDFWDAITGKAHRGELADYHKRLDRLFGKQLGDQIALATRDVARGIKGFNEAFKRAFGVDIDVAFKRIISLKEAMRVLNIVVENFVRILRQYVIPYLGVILLNSLRLIALAILGLTIAMPYLSVAFSVAGDIIVAEFDLAWRTVSRFFDILTNLVSLVVDLVHGNWAAAWQDLKNIVGDVFGQLLDIVASGFGLLATILRDVGLGGVVDFAQGCWDWITTVAIPAVESFWTDAKFWFNLFWDLLTNTVIPAIVHWANTLYDFVVSVAIPALESFWQSAQDKVKGAVGFFTELSDGATAALAGIETAVVDVVNSFVGLYQAAQTDVGTVGGVFATMWIAIKGVAGVIGAAIQPILAAFDAIKAAVAALPTALPGWLGDAGSWVAGAVHTDTVAGGGAGTPDVTAIENQILSPLKTAFSLAATDLPSTTEVVAFRAAVAALLANPLGGVSAAGAATGMGMPLGSGGPSVTFRLLADAGDLDQKVAAVDATLAGFARHGAYQAKIDADATPYYATMSPVVTAADTFGKRTYQTTIDADASSFDTTFGKGGGGWSGWGKSGGDVLSAVNAFAAATYKTTIGADAAPFYAATSPVVTAADTFGKRTYQTTIDADTAPFFAKFYTGSRSDVLDLVQEFGGNTYTTKIAADASAFDATFGKGGGGGWSGWGGGSGGDVLARAGAFAAATYTTAIAADTSPFDNAFSPVLSALYAFSQATYTATVSVDTAAALAALADLAAHLPHSPAKKGPLARVPNFDYVADSFKKSVERMKHSIGGIPPFGATGSRFGHGPGGQQNTFYGPTYVSGTDPEDWRQKMASYGAGLARG
jgi:TP901 family phage tail tape measure protein